MENNAQNRRFGRRTTILAILVIFFSVILLSSSVVSGIVVAPNAFQTVFGTTEESEGTQNENDNQEQEDVSLSEDSESTETNDNDVPPAADTSDSNSPSVSSEENAITLPNNSPPEATGGNVEVFSGGTVEINLAAFDPDPDEVFTFHIQDRPSNGRLGEFDGNRIPYISNEGFEGTDSFTFTVRDGEAESNEAEIIIEVKAPANRPPTAEGGTVEAQSGQPTAITMAASDPDAGEEFAFSIKDDPDFGKLTGLDGNVLTYTSNEGFAGNDVFRFSVSDGEAESEEAEVVIKVNAPPSSDQPAENSIQLESSQRSTLAAEETCSADYCVEVGETLTFTILCSNTDPRAIDDCIMVAGPTGATLTTVQGNPAIGTFTWTPEAAGSFSASFQAITVFCPPDVENGCPPSPIKTFSIEVTQPNRPPVANAGEDQTGTVGETITLNGEGSSDPDDDDLTYSWSQIAGTPSVNLNNPSTATPTFTAPTVDETTTLTFQLMVNDGTVDSEEPDTVDVTIEPCGCGSDSTSLTASSSSGKEDSCTPQEKKEMTEMLFGTFEYPVKGSSLAEVVFLTAFSEEPLEGNGGMTHVGVNVPNLPPKKGFVDCKSKVVVTITKVLPKYDPRDFKRLTPAEKTEWDRFLSALNVHENGHVQGAQQYFQGFGVKLLDKNKSEVINFVNEQKRLYKQMVSDPYDLSTGHGADVGAVLDTSP